MEGRVFDRLGEDVGLIWNIDPRVQDDEAMRQYLYTTMSSYYMSRLEFDQRQCILFDQAQHHSYRGSEGQSP